MLKQYLRHQFVCVRKETHVRCVGLFDPHGVSLLMNK